MALRHRRNPFHLRPVVEQELLKLEQQGVIEKVTGPTPWVSPMVIAEKPKQPGHQALHRHEDAQPGDTQRETLDTHSR